jgi:predicted porin
MEIYMKTTIKLAVASALLAAASSASAAGGIVAGDWTLDIGGNVNAFYTHTNKDAGVDNQSTITTGLLPNFLSVSGKTRQNDLDVGFTISMQPGAATGKALTLGTINQRQAFITFGDKSWGSIKVGKDLGIYASDAILSDMTLLGVGAGGANASGNTTLGRIGYGYQYADWKSQIAYSSPNWNGFSFTAGITQGWNPDATAQEQVAYEAKASYEWAGDVAGKVWVSGISQKVNFNATAAYGRFNPTTGAPEVVAATTASDERVNAMDIGANVNVAGFGLTGYYSKGEGTGTLGQMNDGTGKKDNEDWYVQATYTIPGVGTKLGASYGESSQDLAASGSDEATNEMWTIGAYHPLTKHLNLVAEYSQATNKTDAVGVKDVDADTVSLGAILFF